MLTSCPSLAEQPTLPPERQKISVVVSEVSNPKRNVGRRQLSSSSSRPPLFSSKPQKKETTHERAPPAACHPPKDDVTEWKQGHDLNMSERVEEELNSIYRSNSSALLSRVFRIDGTCEVFRGKICVFFLLFPRVCDARRTHKDLPPICVPLCIGLFDNDQADNDLGARQRA